MTLEPEIRNGYKVSSQMKRIWDIQLEMLEHVLDVCNRNNLRIWAEGGTLLGTVREHGYIPWDDDIDLMMPREDYDKLVSIANKEFNKPFFFQCAYTDKRYYRGHAQVRYENTCMALPGDLFQAFNQSVFIDIFVYDAIPDVLDSEWELRLKRADEISNYLFISSYTRIFSGAFLSAVIGRLRIAFGRGLSLFREYENLFRKYKWQDNNRIACPCFNRTIINNYTREKGWYRETVYLPFEDIMLPAPIDYDKVLSTQYGDDYMMPRMAPSMHGGGLIIDTEKSYSVVLRKLRSDNRKQTVIRKVSKFFAFLSDK